MAEARNLRTISVRLNEDDMHALRALRSTLNEATNGGNLYGQLSPDLAILRDVRGAHAPYGAISDSQAVRWALRFALDRFQAPQLTDPPPAPSSYSEAAGLDDEA